MYIKFCRSYDADAKPSDEAKKKLSLESKLSVDLEGLEDKQTQGNVRVYRALCVCLGIICLVLLLVITILGVKLQTGPTVCPEGAMSVAEDKERSIPPQTCSFEKCQTYFPRTQPQRGGCHKCADGWLALDSSCFYLSRHKLSWEESQRNCTARGGNLAVITDQKVQNFLSNRGYMSYWIGLRHGGSQWTWVNNSLLGESYWAEDHSVGDCGILNGGDPPEKSWTKASCHSYTYYICQLQP
ncbi:C-type lectin lectoxin-Lio3 isoform X2 [Centroberyx affinis]|uniref:C-type lectin lectoxin-Lio3 isoform X2 n=1 Tax=Centroberyx affinis TaxID=166261 RepID=UPI003A5C05F7